MVLWGTAILGQALPSINLAWSNAIQSLTRLDDDALRSDGISPVKECDNGKWMKMDHDIMNP